PLCARGLKAGANQRLFVGPGERKRTPHAQTKGRAKAPNPLPIGALAGDRVPWIDEPECVGCNLCQLVCPVPGCITMEEIPGPPRETWNDRVAQGRDKIPGGIHD